MMMTKTWKAVSTYHDPQHPQSFVVHDTGVSGTDDGSVQEATEDADSWYRNAELEASYELRYED